MLKCTRSLYKGFGMQIFEGLPVADLFMVNSPFTNGVYKINNAVSRQKYKLDFTFSVDSFDSFHAFVNIES